MAVVRGDDGATRQERVRVYIRQHAPQRFTINDVRKAVPGISDQTIRLVLNELNAAEETTHSRARLGDRLDDRERRRPGSRNPRR